MKIALAHDTLTQQGGAERVLNALHQIFPQAPLFTLVIDPFLREKYRGWDIRTSQLQTLFLVLPKLQYLLPLIPPSVDKMDFSGFDAVVSSSSSFLKNLRAPKNTVHICYCHTPTRFLWKDQDYVKQEVPVLLRPLANWYLKQMKKWDYAGAQRVTQFIANSKEVQVRIKKYYNRDSVVIYPGIDVNFWHPTMPKSNYFLLAGRLQAHKKNDFAIKIFNQLGLPLRVVGSGRNLEYLKSIAKANVSFLGPLSDEDLRDQYSGAMGFIYPQEEDFGLMPLEAAACGTATLGLAKGGSLETIIPGVTGELFSGYIESEIKQIISSWGPTKYSLDKLRFHAENFSTEKFKDKISEFIKSKTSL